MSESDQSTKLSPAEQADHERSVFDYPWLDLEDDEYVVIDIERSLAGKFFVWFCSIGASLFFIASALVIIFVDEVISDIAIATTCLFCVVISLLVGLAFHWVYNHNQLILTNQRVFGRVQSTLFSQRTQTLEIEHIEDVSYTQDGILPIVFDYGSLRMSTVGDEHTYSLTFVSDPANQVRVVKKVVNAVDEQKPTRYHK